MAEAAETPQSTNLTPAEGTAKLAAQLSAGKPGEPEQQPPQPDAPEPEQTPVETPEGQEEPSEEPPPEEAPDEADDTPPEGQDIDIPPHAMVTVPVDGRPVRMPWSEVQNGYMRQADHTRKSQ